MSGYATDQGQGFRILRNSLSLSIILTAELKLKLLTATLSAGPDPRVLIGARETQPLIGVESAAGLG